MNRNWMPVAGGVILVAVLAYFAFQSVDRLGSSSKESTAVLIGKEHLPPRKTYRTDYIAGHARVIPQFLPDTYVFKLRIGNDEVGAAVDRSLFDQANNGDRFAVTYRLARLTRKLEVTSVQAGVH